MQSGNVQHRTALTRTTQQRGPHDDQQKPESSRQEHQAGGIDGKSPTELLAADEWRLDALLLFAKPDEFYWKLWPKIFDKFGPCRMWPFNPWRFVVRMPPTIQDGDRATRRLLSLPLVVGTIQNVQNLSHPYSIGT